MQLGDAAARVNGTRYSPSIGTIAASSELRSVNAMLCWLQK
jgi:hypothetical protein